MIGIGTGPKATGSADTETIFGLCSQLMDWQPFSNISAAESQLPALLRGLDTEEVGFGAKHPSSAENQDSRMGKLGQKGRVASSSKAWQHQLKPAPHSCFPEGTAGQQQVGHEN